MLLCNDLFDCICARSIRPPTQLTFAAGAALDLQHWRA